METTEYRSSLQEEIRVRRRAKNKAKKEELKRLREEDKRRKLFEPKDQRVRVVPYKEAETFRSSQNTINLYDLTLPVLSLSEEFPSLGSEKLRLKSQKVTGQLEGREYKQRAATALAQHKENRQELIDVKGQVGDLSHVGKDTNQNILSSGTSDNLRVQETQSSTKIHCAKPKRADPIHLDLLTVLKQNKSNTVDKRAGPSAATKKKVPSHLSGNQLDSSNPERKKGKKRENVKPPKPTRLKSVILQDRLTRTEQQPSNILTSNQNTNDHISNNGAVLLSNDQLHGVTKSTDSTDFIIQTVTDINQLSEVEVASITTEVIPTIEESFSHCVIASEREISLSSIAFGENRPGIFGNSILDDESNKSKNSSAHPNEKIVTYLVHCRKFRGYCDHVLSPILDNAVRTLLQDIVKFQDRQYFSDPIKAHAKRRFVLGFRETQKYLKLKKVKLIIIAPDLEQAQSEGGIDDTVTELKTGSKSQEVPYVFALCRKDLRRITNKSFHVRGISCIGVINYEGSQDNFQTIQEILPVLRSQYLQLTGHEITPTPVEVEKEDVKPAEVVDVNTQVVASFLVKLTKELESA